MNINLHHFFKSGFCLLLLGLLPMLLSAQVSREKQETGFIDSLLTFHLVSVNHSHEIITPPTNGEIVSVELIDASSYLYEVKYQPFPSFVGYDNIVFKHWATVPPNVAVGFVHTDIQLKIVPSLVEAKHDYGVIEEGETLTIEVVSNDSVSHGDLYLNPVFPVVNHGKASLSDQSGFVDFKPESGFTGLADFNYIACDELGTCATGAASVYVNPKGKIYNDEIRLGTGQNTKKSIPMPFMVTATDLPNKVKIEVSRYAVVYEPEFDQAGQERFTVFGEGGHQRTIVMDIIERPVSEQSLAADDVNYALLGETIQVDVLTNDLMETTRRVDFFPLNGGTIEKISKGVFNFVPNRGFSGVARIAYRALDAHFNPHWAYAYIVYNRHNFGPNDKDYAYEFFVEPGQAKAIDYNAPISNYQLLPDDNSSAYGELEAQSKGSLMYYAPEEVFEDEFEILYCAPANAHPEDCQKVKITMHVREGSSVNGCSNDCVLPGDLNADGIVNSLDLLPLGLQIGEIGPERTNKSTQFTPQIAADWNMTLIDGSTNLKHHDANGDGVLTERDVQAIVANYGQVNHLIPFSPPALAKGISISATRVTPSLEEVPLGEPIPAGTLIELEIAIGEEEAQELDLYGFTFPFKMSGKSWIDPASFKVTFHDDSWTALNSPTLTLQKEVPSTNADQISLDLAFTRTSKTAVSGLGKLATVGFIVIEDNLEGIRPQDDQIDFNIAIGQSYSINQDGQYYEYEGTGITVPVSISQTTSVETLPPSAIALYPNPATDQLTVQLEETTNVITDITVYNMAGAHVYRATNLQTVTQQVPVGQLPEGLYIAQLMTEEGMVAKKFQVIR